MDRFVVKKPRISLPMNVETEARQSFNVNVDVHASYCSRDLLVNPLQKFTIFQYFVVDRYSHFMLYKLTA